MRLIEPAAAVNATSLPSCTSVAALRLMVVPTRTSPFSSVWPSASMIRFRNGILLPIASRKVTPPPAPVVVKLNCSVLSVVPSIRPVISMSSPAVLVVIPTFAVRTTPSLITTGFSEVTSPPKVVVPPEPLIRNTPPAVSPATATLLTNRVSCASIRN